jgi:hypothetical protein
LSLEKLHFLANFGLFVLTAVKMGTLKEQLTSGFFDRQIPTQDSIFENV